jgi:hypothetical protein
MVGMYVVEDRLSVGAFAHVFAGVHSMTSEMVAIKQLRRLPTFWQGPHHEFDMTRRAAHKNVVTVLEQ